jgi:DNA-binding NtrC family response regulator
MSSEPSSDLPSVLFVDDDPDVLATAGLLLARRGFRMRAARGPEEALSQVAAEPPDVILLDLNFSPRAVSGEEGLQLLRDLLRCDPKAAVVVVTGHSGVNVAVAAMRSGAADFVMKPWSNSRLVVAVEDALRKRRVGSRPPSADSGEPARAEAEPVLMLGASPPTKRVRELAARAAATPAAVLISGEPGTGKSLLARVIHAEARPARPFAVLDLRAAPAGVQEEAAFVEGEGARALAEARGGDLVLDEIGWLSPALQGRLAALLTGPEGAEVRTIGLTARPRAELEGPQGLRSDLFYRLSTLEIGVPALRERREDIPVLAGHFLRLYALRYGRPERPLSTEAARMIAVGAWPGNVRALKQAIERGVILSDGPEVEILGLQAAVPEEPAPITGPAGRAAPTLAHSEKTLIEAALKRHSFNVSRAARDLDLTRAALYRRMAKHGL